MTFVTLENRFNQVSKQIYNRFAPSEDQLVTIKPDTTGIFGSKSRVKNDSRGLPVVSTLRDIKRISRFWNSPEGRLFVGKQTLLQGANTFAETRLYDIRSINKNANTFLGRGSIRHIPLSSGPIIAAPSGGEYDLKLPGLLNMSSGTREHRGGLQQETVVSFDSRIQASGTIINTSPIQPSVNVLRSKFQAGKNTLFSPFKQTKQSYLTEGYFLRPEDTIFYVTPISFEISTSANRTNVTPRAISSTGVKQFYVQDVSRRGSPNTTLREKTNFVSQYKKFAEQSTRGSQSSKLSFKQLENRLNTNGYFSGINLSVLNFDADNPTTISSSIVNNTSNVQDPYNLEKVVTGTTSLYKNILGNPKENIPLYTGQENKPDIITFSFKTAQPGAESVHFRAFLSSFKQNVKTEYTDQRYVGRTERFVTYGGAKRTANIQFNIAAFSSQEINQAWARVNYLTGLAFPLGFSASGFMVPPLFRLTIGGIYQDQPCYLDSLDFDFIDDSITFDIDSEVSQVINVSMNIVLLEKRSKFYDSPFYRIMEKTAGE